MGEHVYDMIVVGAVPARELLARCPAATSRLLKEESVGGHVYDMIVVGAVPARELLARCPAGRGQEMAIV